LDPRLKALLCKKILVAKSEEMKTESDLAESFMEGYGSKGAVLPTMLMPVIFCPEVQVCRAQHTKTIWIFIKFPPLQIYGGIVVPTCLNVPRFHSGKFGRLPNRRYNAITLC
jgi:hypothetical protein